MKNILSGLCAATLALSFGFASLAPVTAAPAFVPKPSEASESIQNVQFSPVRRHKGNRAENRMERRKGGFERRGNEAYYNGHRGYNEPRRGYRQHNGVWFPAAAFIAGAIGGGAIDNQPRARGNAHVQYCYDRYRSYRASDNTFQPNSGPRRQCISS
ncbi:BA14K family protein [Mesorhizobium sp. SB112]|uniref:BA14K family protein n=1 Tax=Mesorhizobium sp. SB112 TaxID=3151853 RepID=UPI0032664225